MLNHKNMILDYMQRNGGITQAEAYEALGCTRLGARIWDLRHDGHMIKRFDVVGTNRFGHPVRYARYVLAE